MPRAQPTQESLTSAYEKIRPVAVVHVTMHFTRSIDHVSRGPGASYTALHGPRIVHPHMCTKRMHGTWGQA